MGCLGAAGRGCQPARGQRIGGMDGDPTGDGSSRAMPLVASAFLEAPLVEWLANRRSITRMSFRPPDFIIDPDKPFKHDRLDRRARVESLCQRVLDDPGPLVVAVNGEFGSGKSVFLRMCAAHLRRGGTAVCEFDAWQHSHTKNPLVDLVAALNRDAPQTGKLVTIVKGIGWGLSAAATRGAINKGNFNEDAVESPFDDWKKIEESRLAFHSTLEQAISEHDNKLVILIDELDRCLPQQALDILNIARHLFDVPGAVVVLGVNQQELAYRVQQVYGQDCDGETYLRRFWDLPIALPRPDEADQVSYLQSVFNGAEVSHRLSTLSDNYTYPILKLLVDRTGMSLRDIQQAVHYLAAVLVDVDDPSVPSDNPLDGRLLVEQMVMTAFALRVVDRPTYDDWISGNRDGFFAVSELRKKLEIEPEHVVGVQMAALLLSVSLDVRFVETADDFVSRFAALQIGGEDLARNVWVRCKDNEPYLVGWSPSLDRLDELLNLLG